MSIPSDLFSFGVILLNAHGKDLCGSERAGNA